MKANEFISECTRGGPGLDGYAWRSDLYCTDCGRAIVREIAPALAPTLEDTTDPLYHDSDVVPQPVFFLESDCREYCAACGEYMYGG